MRLTRYSDLGLRLMMYLSLREGEPVTIGEASERLDISKNHLVKISHHLTQAGLIESTRGRNGGVQLAFPPELITVEKVLRATEDNFDLVECLTESENRCIISGACKLAAALEEAREAFFASLRRVSMADLIKGRRALERSLLPAGMVRIPDARMPVRRATK
ncbi:MAG TPA: Rrf2 family transcriptional regulator [Gallionella sp.]